MGIGRLNIWVSDVADACGTWRGSGRVTIFDCDGILSWPCGRFRTEGTDWQPVPNGFYRNLPFRCGHLEAELPPGCYWVIAGNVSPGAHHIHLNYTTHVGIVQVGCDQHACVKLYNPSIRLCWNWFRIALQIEAAKGRMDREAVGEVEKLVEGRLLEGVPRNVTEGLVEEYFGELVDVLSKDEPD